MRAKAAGVLTAPVTWLLVFLLIPLVLVAAVGFATVQSNYLLDFGRLTPENYVAVFNPSGEAFRLLWRSLGIAFGATVASLVVGYAMAYYIARIAKEKWRGILMALVVIPFWVTFIVRIYGLLLFVRPDGFVDGFFQTLGLPGVGDYFVTNFGVGTDSLLIFTLVYVWLPFMVLPLFTSLSKIDPQLLEAASDLGASRLRAFWNVTLPLSLPGIVTGSIFVFITTLGSFVEPQFLSASPMIGNFVENQFSGAQGVGIPVGSAASMFIIISTMLLLTVYTRYAEIEESGVYGAKKEKTNWGQVVRLAVFALGVLALGAASVYLLTGALAARSVGGVLDATLLLALLNLFASYVAGEFLVMAATLIHIKSRMLLPRVDPTQEDPDEDPREALVRRLLEHQKFKAAAELLHERETLRSAQWTRADGPIAEIAGEAPEPEVEVDLFSLISAFRAVVERAKQRPKVYLPSEQIPIEDRIEQLMTMLSETEACGFEDLFADVQSRAGMIVTFLAMLEMIRLKLIRVFQSGAMGPIRVYKRARPADAPKPLLDPDERHARETAGSDEED